MKTSEIYVSYLGSPECFECKKALSPRTNYEIWPWFQVWISTRVLPIFMAPRWNAPKVSEADQPFPWDCACVLVFVACNVISNSIQQCTWPLCHRGIYSFQSQQDLRAFLKRRRLVVLHWECCYHQTLKSPCWAQLLKLLTLRSFISTRVNFCESNKNWNCDESSLSINSSL